MLQRLVGPWLREMSKASAPVCEADFDDPLPGADEEDFGERGLNAVQGSDGADAADEAEEQHQLVLYDPQQASGSIGEAGNVDWAAVNRSNQGKAKGLCTMEDLCSSSHFPGPSHQQWTNICFDHLACQSKMASTNSNRFSYLQHVDANALLHNF
jgi:hypothetical protein